LAELGPEEIRPKRLLTGDDLIAKGYRPGPLFSKILTQLEDAQLEGTIKTRDEALEWLRREFGTEDV
jgi:poly(A) polymerase